jgi:hypothetical protein
MPPSHSFSLQRLLVGGVLLAFGCLSLGSAAFAQTSVWNGGSGNWTDNNWTPAAPISTSNVFIDNGNPVASTVVLNVASATINNLTLDSGDTLTLDPIATLTVNGTASLNGTTNVALGTLTLNGASTNSGTMNLATDSVTILGRTFILDEGVINGAGTLTNTVEGKIQGGGTISVALTNAGGTIYATDPNNPLIFTANVNNTGGTIDTPLGSLVLYGSTVTGGIINGNLTGENGATLNNVQLGFEQDSTVNLAAGSTFTIQGTMGSNEGNLKLGNGVTLTGPGTLGNGGEIIATSGQAIVQVKVNGGGLAGNGGTLVLDGSTVTNGYVIGNLTAKNGATLNGTWFGLNPGDIVTLTAGSTLALLGTPKVVGELDLGNGATLTGSGTVMNSAPDGSGIIATSGQGIVQVNVTQSSESGLLGGTGTLVLDGSTVTGGFVVGNIAGKNGATLNNVQIGFDQYSTVNFADGSTLAIQGTVTNVAKSLTLGNGTLIINGTLTNNDGSISNAGVVNIESGGTLNNTFAGSSYIQTAGQTIVDGTMKSVPAVQIQGGVLSGTGTIAGGVLNSGGIVRPGDNGVPGTLVVEGYEQQSGATFDELIGASGNGLLVAVPGGITLDSGALLDIDLLNGFTPTDGETFDIMTAIGISGTFANAPTTGFEMDGFDWTITYDPGEIVLDAVSAVSGGGGGNGGNGGGGNGGTGSTPEPPALFLLGAGLIGLAIWSQRRRLHGSVEDQGLQA